jgi:hypothetical protein
LTRCQSEDCIADFEDLESQCRASNIANHDLAFILCGLRKKWKQSAAFYFIRGRTNCKMLVIFLKDVLDACHIAELVVVATVFDMAANIFKTL